MAASLELATVLAAADLPERQMSREETRDYFMPASLVAYADGEINIVHEPLDGELAELYGERLFDAGSVVHGLRHAAVQNGPHPGPLLEHQHFTAQYVLHTRRHSLPHQLHSGVAIRGQRAYFDGQAIELTRAIETVIDYGPGLAGLSHTSDQVAQLRDTGSTYRYVAITRLPFTNAVLMHSYDTLLAQPGAWRDFVLRQLYVGSSDGMAAASSTMLEQQTALTGSSEIADVVLASGIHLADRQEVSVALQNAYPLLRAGGALIIRSMAEAMPSETSTRHMVDVAQAAGFSPEHSHQFRTLTGIGRTALGAPAAKRPAIAAVLIK